MIQQTKITSSAQQIQYRFEQLLLFQPANMHFISQFVENLFQVQQFDIQNSGLLVLVQCIIKNYESGGKHPQQKIENVTIAFLSEVIDKLISHQFQTGLLSLSKLLSNRSIRQIFKRLYQIANYQNINLKLKQTLNNALSSKEFDILQRALNKASKEYLITIQLLLIANSFLFIHSLIPHNNLVSYNKIIDSIQKTVRNHVEQNVKLFNEKELKMWMEFLYDYQQINPNSRFKAEQMTESAIISLLQYGSLQKKITALSCLDFIAQKIQANDLKQFVKFSMFLPFIIQARSHAQVIYRSCNFLRFWLSTVENQIQLQMLKKWLIEYIIDSDLQTSIIFSNLWVKVVLSIQSIKQIGIKYIYGICIQLLDKIDISDIKRHKGKQQDKQKYNRIIGVIGPVISKRFQPVPTHQMETYRFLRLIWTARLNLPKVFYEIMSKQMQKAILSSISLKFNVYVADNLLKQLNSFLHSPQTNSVQQDTKTNFTSSITQIYKYLNCLVPSLSASQTPNQISKIILQDKVLHSLAQSHNNQSVQQLELLLAFMSSIFQFIGQETKSSILQCIINKANISQYKFLKWALINTNKILKQFLKNKTYQLIFRDPLKYKNVTFQGYQVLMEMIVLWDTQRKNQLDFCFKVIKTMNSTTLQSVIRLVLNTLWPSAALYLQRTLFQIGEVIQRHSIQPWKQIKIYTELLKITPIEQMQPQYLPAQNLEIFYQQTAMKQLVQVKMQIAINKEIFYKVVKCFDNITIFKFKKLYLSDILRSVHLKDCQVSQIFLNEKEINKDMYSWTFRKLGCQAARNQHQANKLQIKLRTFFGKRFGNLTNGNLKILLSNFFKNQESKNISKILQTKHLEQLAKYMESHLNIKPQKISKSQVLDAFKKFGCLVTQNTSSPLLNIQFEQFIKQIDVNNLLLQQPKFSNCSHITFMRKPYFIDKACILLLDNDKNVQKIGFEYLSMLQIVQNVLVDFKWLLYDPVQYCYLLAFGLQTLYIMSRRQNVLRGFLVSGLFNQIFKVVQKCLAFLWSNHTEDQQTLNKIFQILLTGLKLFNKAVLIILIKNKNYQLTMIASQPTQLLCLDKTKNNIDSVFNNKMLQQLVNQDSQLPLLYVVAGTDISVNFTISTQQIFQCLQKFCQIMDRPQYPLNQSRNDIFLPFYQASRLICWALNTNKGIQSQTKMVRFMLSKLNSQCSELRQVCRSIFYIYLVFDGLQNCNSLLDYLFQYFINNANKSQQFYQLFAECFFLCERSQLTQSIIRKLLSLLIDQKEFAFKQNKQLAGILSFMQKNASKINRKECEQFLNITASYLFHTDQQIKATNQNSRRSLYRSIQACLKHHKQINANGLFQLIKTSITIANSVEQQSKNSKTGVGLQNLGNICYMNSLLQLLHSMKNFVSEVCAIKSNYPLLQSLQQLFVSMSTSMKKCVSPQDLIISFDPPLDVGLQQDTTEFMINLLDKLESNQDSGKFRQLAKFYITGQNLSNIICTQCNNKVQKVEDFILYHLSIQNEGKQLINLQQCFDHASKPQVIYDVRCEACNKLTKFTKQTIICEVPKYFVVHLKRLIFDYTNPHSKIKIHSKLEFSDQMVLNKQKLKLKAVITHSGTGQYGHYFTSVKKQNGTWIIYNDSKVFEMPADDRNELWYGSRQGSDFSTNAYVLLYERDSQEPKSALKSTASLKMHTQISESNQILLTRQLLLSSSYIQDFTNFAFNVAIHPSTLNTLLGVYQIIALLSYISHIAPDNNLGCQFQNIQFKDTNQLDELMQAIYQYKDNNIILIFHKDKALRAFFYNYFVRVLDLGLQKSSLALQYACQLISQYTNHLKQFFNFINCSQSLKLISFLCLKLQHSQKFLRQLFSLNFVNKLLQIFDARKQQIQRSQIVGSGMAQSLFQLFNALILISRSNKSKTIPYHKQYAASLQQLRSLLIGNKYDWLQMLFVYNSNENVCNKLQQNLLLDKQEKYVQHLSDVACKYVNNWELLHSRTSKNFCYLLLRIFQKYYCSSQESKFNFINSFFGAAYPLHLHSNNSGRERTYNYQTRNRTSGLSQVIVLILDQSLALSRFEIRNVQVLANLVKLFVSCVSADKIFARYFYNLPSPIGICSHYYQYINQSITSIIQKLGFGMFKSDTLNNKPNIQQLIACLKDVIAQIAKMHQKTTERSSQMSLCGIKYKQPEILMQKVMHNLFVCVQQYDCYWVAYNDGRPLIRQNLSKNCKFQLLNQNTQNRSALQQKISVLNLNQAPEPSSKHSPIRLKFSFTNISEQLDTNTSIIQIRGDNMKNDRIQIIMKLHQTERQEIWIQKKRIQQPWHDVVLSVNGVHISVNQLTDIEFMSMRQQQWR